MSKTKIVKVSALACVAAAGVYPWLEPLGRALLLFSGGSIG